MKRTIIVLTVIKLVLLCSTQIYASGAGTTGGELLRLGTGARSAGMGEAFTAVSDNAHAVHWNPAGLIQLKNKEMQMMYLHHLTDISIGNIAYAQKLGKNAGIGVELLQLYTTGTMRDDNGNEIGEYTNYNGVLTVGYGYKVNDNLSLGLSVKSIYIRYVDQSETASGMDIGGLYSLQATVKPLQLGIVVKDIGKGIPTRVITGISKEVLDNVTMSVDINMEQAGYTELNLGMEYVTGSRFVLRGGYTKLGGWEGVEGIRGICGGAGLVFDNKSFDYAFMPYGELGIAHRISFQMKF